MVERFNGRIADVLRTHRFNSAEDLRSALEEYGAFHDGTITRSFSHSHSNRDGGGIGDANTCHSRNADGHSHDDTDC